MPGDTALHRQIEESASLTGVDRDQAVAPSLGPSALAYVVATGDLVPPWWSRGRDVTLHRLTKESNHLSGIAYLATTKLVNIPLTFVPRDPTISAHVDLADEFTRQLTLVSEYGQTIRETLKRFIYDYLITDNGGFMEVLGGGAPDQALKGPVTGLIHRDSFACTRTNNPLYPVTYEDTDGKRPRRYMLHWTRVIHMSQQPSGLQKMNGVGFGSVSRSFMLAQVLNDQLLYKLEKMGSRPAEKLVVGNNVETEQLYQTYMMAEQVANNLGLRRFGKHIFIGGEGIDVNDIPLNVMDPFDEEVGTNMAMYALFYTWGLDIRDGWPITGSRASDQVALVKARGRLPSDFTKDLALLMDLKVAPPALRTVFDYQDDEEDMQQANIKDIRSRRVFRLADAGAVDTESQRRILLMDGDLPREEFIRQQLADGKLEDGSPIGSLFFATDSIIQPLLDIPETLLVIADNDAAMAKREIQVKKVECYRTIGAERSESRKRKARMALAALEWLENQYSVPQVGQEEPAPEESSRPDEQEESPEDQVEDAQESEKPVSNGQNGQFEPVAKAS